MASPSPTKSITASGAVPAGERHDLVERTVVRLHHVVGAAFLRETQREVGAVEHDDLGRAQRRERLDADMAEAAGADDHGVLARHQVASGLLGGTVGGEPGIGVGSHVLGREALGQLDHAALAGQQVIGVAAGLGDAGEAAVARVHVVAAPGGEAVAAAHQWVADDRVADLDALDAGSDLFHPARVLVPHDVGQGDIDMVVPHALDDVQVGAAHARAADADDDVRRLRDLRIVYILVRHEFGLGEGFVVAVERRCLHGFPPVVSSGVGRSWARTGGRRRHGG